MKSIFALGMGLFFAVGCGIQRPADSNGLIQLVQSELDELDTIVAQNSDLRAELSREIPSRYGERGGFGPGFYRWV